MKLSVRCELSKNESSNIRYIFLKTDDILIISFRTNGSTSYMYKNVPLNIVCDFIQAESKGKYFIKNIKDIYSFEKIDYRNI